MYLRERMRAVFLTADMDEFYKLQGQLLLAINDALQAAHLELV